MRPRTHVHRDSHCFDDEGKVICSEPVRQAIPARGDNSSARPLRYIVSIWHGEGGSIATIIDRKTDRCMGYYSTVRNGADWMAGALRQRDALNKATS